MYNTTKKLIGSIELNGDKSISHRLLMIGSLIDGSSKIRNLSLCDDVMTTIDCLLNCNIQININNTVTINGNNFISPKNPLNCKNSGTSVRLLLGLLSGQKINFSMIGDKSLMRRPMRRVIEPLTKMNTYIIHKNYRLPITVESNDINTIHYNSKTTSAQVKSSLIFAALGIDQYSFISYNKKTRDHTERLLNYFGFDIDINDQIKVKRKNIKKGFVVDVPGDISNASFIIAAAILLPDSDVIIKNVLYNNTRFGFIKSLIRMGANIKIDNIRISGGPESLCDIYIKYSNNLNGISIKGDQIISMIDEIPIFCIIATQAKGMTTLRDTSELRFKESDRILSIYSNLSKMNASVRQREDGLDIEGGKRLYSTTINHYGDHRIAMSFEILNLLLNNEMNNTYQDIINISFPEFYSTINSLLK